jgi:glycerophosphoryl diester phosphodiesterase
MKISKKGALALVASAFVYASCSTLQHTAIPSSFPSFFKVGHRGTRGLMPENSIQAMEKAMEVGANIIETDVYTSKDGQVFVSHDPTPNSTHMLYADGSEIKKADEKKYILHQMNYADIRKFDTGTKYYPQFPQQAKIKTYLPLLSEMIDSVENYTAKHNLPKPIYLIELKNREDYDNKFNAVPAELSDAVMEVVNKSNIGNRYYIQSFDVRPLQHIRKKYPKVPLGYLVSTPKFDENIKLLGFNPDVYSPNAASVTQESIDKCKKDHIGFVPWTVNTIDEMQKFKNMGVTGIITDYPNLFKDLK